MRATETDERGRHRRIVITGCIAAIAITICSYGAGAVPMRPGALESAGLGWMRFGHGLVISTVGIWAGVALLVMSWMRLGRMVLGGQVGPRTVATATALWASPLLLAVPLYSRDVYTYLTEGAMMRSGLNPFTEGAADDTASQMAESPLINNLHPFWTTTVSPYGPVFMWICRAVVAVTGDNAIAGVIGLRVAMIGGLALAVWATAAIATHCGTAPEVAIWISCANPLVLLHLVGGVHNETLMVGLMAAAIVAVLRGRVLVGFAVLALACSIKATAVIALPMLVWVWYRRRVGPINTGQDSSPINTGQDSSPMDTGQDSSPRSPGVKQFLISATGGVGIFAITFGLISLICGLGFGWVDGLSLSNRIITLLSAPTIVAHVITLVLWPWHTVALMPVLTVVRNISLAVFAAVAIVIWWRSRHSQRSAIAGIAWVMVAFVVLSPASLPWYYSWPLVLAGAFTLRPVVAAALVGASTWMLIVFGPADSFGLYSIGTEAAAITLGALAGISLLRPDPLRIGKILGAQQLPGLEPNSAAKSSEPARVE